MEFNNDTETIIPNSGNVLTIEGTGGLCLPKGTTAQRPTATTGLIRYNTNNNEYEVYYNSIWKNLLTTTSTNTQQQRDIEYVFATDANPYITISLNDSSFKTIFRFIFRGSTILGIPTSIKVVGMLSFSSITADIRLLNVTQGTIIASKTNINNITAEIINLGTLSNIPSSEVILELQVIMSSGKASKEELHLNSFHIQF